ncbi:MAG: ParM/StbA family protein [Thermoproteota archaeon]
MNVSILSVDIGYGWTKACWLDEGKIKCLRFPSSFARINDSLLLSPIKGQVYKGAKYIVGEEAVVSAWGVSVRDIDSLIEYSPIFVSEAITRIVREGAFDIESTDLIIAVGLPPRDVRGKGRFLTEALKELVTPSGVIIPFKVEVFPQAVSPFAEISIYPGAPKITQNSISLLIDIGHNTLDVIPFSGSKPIAGEVMSLTKGGFCRILDSLRDILRQEYGVTVHTLHEVFTIFKNRSCMVRGIRQDLSYVVDSVVNGYVEWLIITLRERWEERLAVAEALILIGASANMIKKHLPEGFREIAFVPPDPEFANARSFLIYAANKHGVPVNFTAMGLNHDK